jgi:hypothetical protein
MWRPVALHILVTVWEHPLFPAPKPKTGAEFIATSANFHQTAYRRTQEGSILHRHNPQQQY